MSFFKKLKDEFKELVGDKDKEKEADKQQSQAPDHSTALRDAHAGSYSQPSQSYGQHQQPPPPQGQYSQGPPQNYNQGFQQGPPQGPHLPPGWVQQWDANSQRYYYIDPQTGRSQWEPPQQSHSYNAPPGPHGEPYGVPGSTMDRGFNQSAYPAPTHYASTYPTNPQQAKSGGGKGGLIAAGVGGAAIGALGAAALSGDSSDEETRAPAAAATGAPYDQSGYGYGAPPPAAEPPLEDNPELSSSQRSSLEEARENLEEAEAEVQGDSSPSSSDVEELEEAREEYAEEVSSAEEELED